ncbi:hypothetical protein, partial [Kalamiella sp. sgz302252]|uniref:hypothetical protein n=1 Tax=Pantoea sp. sgz302252 TaxID=3341827 RepID=UPI0036D26A50
MTAALKMHGNVMKTRRASFFRHLTLQIQQMLAARPRLSSALFINIGLQSQDHFLAKLNALA